MRDDRRDNCRLRQNAMLEVMMSFAQVMSTCVGARVDVLQEGLHSCDSNTGRGIRE